MALVQIPTLSGDDVTTHVYEQTSDLLGAKYRFEFKYNARMRRWTLNMFSPEDEPMLTGAVVLLNVNLLNYCPPKLHPGGFLVATWVSDDESAEEATEFDLGDRVKLYYYERAEDLNPVEPTEPELA